MNGDEEDAPGRDVIFVDVFHSTKMSLVEREMDEESGEKESEEPVANVDAWVMHVGDRSDRSQPRLALPS